MTTQLNEAFTRMALCLLKNVIEQFSNVRKGKTMLELFLSKFHDFDIFGEQRKCCS